MVVWFQDWIFMNFVDFLCFGIFITCEMDESVCGVEFFFGYFVIDVMFVDLPSIVEIGIQDSSFNSFLGVWSFVSVVSLILCF